MFNDAIQVSRDQTPCLRLQSTLCRLTSSPYFFHKPTSFPPSPKIQDLKSFEAEVLNKIHNISHVPSHLHQHHHHHHQQQQQLHNYPANHHNAAHFFNDSRQRYRSNNDLLMDDAMSMEFEGPFNGLGRRQPSISELMLLQKVATVSLCFVLYEFIFLSFFPFHFKTSSQMHSPLGGSIYDLPYRDLSSHRLTDMDNHKVFLSIYHCFLVVIEWWWIVNNFFPCFLI